MHLSFSSAFLKVFEDHSSKIVNYLFVFIVFISLPSSCLVSEQAGAGLGWHPPFPSSPGCAPGRSLAATRVLSMDR